MNKCKITDCDGEVKAKGLCDKHYLRLHRHGSTELPRCQREKLLEHGKCYCPACKRTKPVEEFNKDKHAFMGIARYCRDCNKKKSTKRYAEYPDRHKNTIMKSKFGITLDDYKVMLKQQGGACAICHKPETENGKMLAIDHDHKTQRVRGLLCITCNQGLGLFCDSPKVLQSAIQYLNEAIP